MGIYHQYGYVLNGTFKNERFCVPVIVRIVSVLSGVYQCTGVSGLGLVITCCGVLQFGIPMGGKDECLYVRVSGGVTWLFAGVGGWA